MALITIKKPEAKEPAHGGAPAMKSPAGKHEVKEDFSAVTRRLKLIEEQMTDLRRKFQVTEHNELVNNKKYNTEFKTINSEMSELRITINKLQDKIVLMIKEFELLAKKEDLDVLKKYIEMWEPVTFVTRHEVENIVDDIVQKKLK